MKGKKASKGEIVLLKNQQQIIKNIGKRIRQLRKEKGYKSHETFAYDHNIDRTQWGKYERGANLEMTTFIMVLAALEVSFQEFFAEGFD